MKHIAFVNAMIFDSVEECFKKGSILVTDGFIDDITCGEVPEKYYKYDLFSKHVIPGLVDVHTHGIGGYDFNYASEDEVASMCKTYAKHGTTSVMATLASRPMSNLMNSIFAINPNRLAKKNEQAGIIGIHMEGRYLSAEKRGAHNIEYLAEPNASELNSLAQAMMPAPLHFSLAPELNGACEFIKQARELGATIGIAHSNATYEQASEAVSLGATSFTHTFNAMSPIHHRMPGVATCALTTDSAYAEVICDGHHLHPAIVNLIYKAKPKDKMVLITDSMAATASPDGEYDIAGTPVFVKNGLATDEKGTLAGSTITMFLALKNLMKFCKLPLTSALRYATTNPAKMVGAEFVGELKKHYRADFIVLDDINDLKINSVFVGGNKID